MKRQSRPAFTHSHFKFHRLGISGGFPGIRIASLEPSFEQHVHEAGLGPLDALRFKLIRHLKRHKCRLMRPLATMWKQATSGEPVTDSTKLIADVIAVERIESLLTVMERLAPAFSATAPSLTDKRYDLNDVLTFGFLLSDLAAMSSLSYAARYEKHLRRTLLSDQKRIRGQRSYRKSECSQIAGRYTHYRLIYRAAAEENQKKRRPLSITKLQERVAKDLKISQSTLRRALRSPAPGKS